MGSRVVGLDIGTYSVKAVHVESRSRGSEYDVVAWHEQRLELDDEARLIPERVQEAQSEALKLLLEQGVLTADWVVSGLSGHDAHMYTVFVPFGDKKKIEAVLPGILEMQLPFELDSFMISWQLARRQPIEKVVSDTEKSIEHAVWVAYAKKASIQRQLALMAQVGLEPIRLGLKSTSLYEYLDRTFDKSTAPSSIRLAIDVGFRETQLCAAVGTDVLLARSIFRGVYDGETFEALLRDLRQMRQVVLSQHKHPIAQVALLGGGAYFPRLKAAIEEIFGCGVVVDEKPAFGLAMAYAISGLPAFRRDALFNFRKGEFSYRGQLSAVRQKAVPIAVWCAVLFFTLMLNLSTRAVFTGKELAQVQEQQEKICKSVVGSQAASSSQCLKLIREQIEKSKKLSVPQFSAADIYLEISQLIPSSLSLKVTDLTIGAKEGHIKGYTDNFEIVDKIVESLTRSRCLKNIDKGRARQIDKGVDFQISFQVDCT